jgi:hypothetical protein
MSCKQPQEGDNILRNVIAHLSSKEFFVRAIAPFWDNDPQETKGPDLHHWRAERRFAQVDFRESAPNLNFGDILHVRGENDFLFVVRSDERLGLELVEEIDISVGIHDLPMRIRCVRHHKVVGKSQNIFSILVAVRNCSLVGLGALELRGSVGATLREGASGTHGESCNRENNKHQFQKARHFIHDLFLDFSTFTFRVESESQSILGTSSECPDFSSG